VLTDGRLEIGLGAGWVKNEYEAMGVHHDPAGVRVDRLGDTAQVIKQIMGDGMVSFDGKTGVHASGFEGIPKPVQRPHPPIAIGGGGRRVLRMAAPEADIVGFNTNQRARAIVVEARQLTGANATEERVTWVREAAGDRFPELELEIGAYHAMITDDPKGTAEALRGTFGLSAEEILDHPHALIGSVAGICETLQERRTRFGFSYVTVLERDARAFAPVVERMAGT